MIQIKKLKQPGKKSGKALPPGAVSEWKKYGVKIVNTGKYVLFVDSVTPKKK
jgi:hypothetical protein